MKKVDDFFGFLLQETGERIITHGKNKKALISNAKDKISFYDDKFIRVDFEIKTGDIIEYQTSRWIINSEVHISKASYKARMRKSNYRIKMVVSEELCEFDAIIKGVGFGISEGIFMNLEDGKIEVTVPDDYTSSKISVGTRFIKMGRAWEVVGIDKTKIGIYILYCEKRQFIVGDDVADEIANKDKIAIWEITIDQGNKEVELNKDFTFIATVRKNGTEIRGQEVIWQSSDTRIATVENGVVKGIALGSVEISVFVKEKLNLNEKISIEVIESLPDIITYKMWNSYTDVFEKDYDDFSIMFEGKYYGADKYINGVISGENDTYTFELNPNGVPTSKFVFSIVDGYKCEILHKKSHYPEKLILTIRSNQSGEVLEKYIELANIW